MQLATDDIVFSHLVAATDFSEESLRAVAVAASMARRCHAKLAVVHVLDVTPIGLSLNEFTRVPDIALAKQQRRKAEMSLADICAGLDHANTTWRVISAAAREGEGEALCNFTRDEGADLLVVGSHGRTGLMRFLLGSVAESVARHAPSSVLVVRNDQDHASFPARIHACTDLSAKASTGLTLVAQMAETFDARVRLLHAEEPRYHQLDATVHKRVVAAVTAELESLYRRHFTGEPAVEVLSGKNVVDALTTHAMRTMPDLLVVATHGRTGVERLVTGSVAQRVTRHAPCSVLITRRSEPAQEVMGPAS